MGLIPRAFVITINKFMNGAKKVNCTLFSNFIGLKIEIILQMALNQKSYYTKKAYETKLKSEKFVIDLFCKRFFGFTIFGKFKNEI